MSEYTQQAENFLTKHNLSFRATFVDNGYFFADDKETRNIYKLSLLGAGKRLTVKFGQSIYSTKTGEIPTAYDMLSCIPKSDPGTFEDFCGEFGYDSDSRSAMKTYRKVKVEWIKVSNFFTVAQLDEAQEIS